MSDRAPQPACFASLPKEITDAAVAWAVKLDYGQLTPKVRRDFERWLCADPLTADQPFVRLQGVRRQVSINFTWAGLSLQVQKTVRGEPLEPRFLSKNALRPLSLPKCQGERMERKS